MKDSKILPYQAKRYMQRCFASNATKPRSKTTAAQAKGDDITFASVVKKIAMQHGRLVNDILNDRHEVRRQSTD